MAEKWVSVFRMRALPTAEFKLHKAMIEHFELRDSCELFTILLRLGHEVLQFGEKGEGKQWFVNVVNQYRSQPGEVREYPLS